MHTRTSQDHIHEVELHNTKGYYRKHMKRMMNGELLLIKEMLSDGDEFHNQILHEVKSLEDKLINLYNRK
tara:strand:- start:184 stop:393 length:210 start_codon:yes stop_codon:yes gene_type:complete